MMRFLCDVHIPINLAKALSQAGHDAKHVNRMPQRWNTPDQEIARTADNEDRILISKDSDFRDSCIVQGSPRKLIKVNLGNIPHASLNRLLLSHLDAIEQLDKKGRFLIEVDLDRLSVVDLP